MGAFEYTALNEKGKESKGVLEGDNARQVRQQLRERGWMALSVEEVHKKEARAGSRQLSFARGISPVDLSLITRQISTLVRSGLPVEEALRAVSEQTEKSRIRNMIMGVRSRVMEGHTMADALNDYPHIFNELFRSTVEAGEQSGHLTGVLERLADYTEARQQMRQKIVIALVYPILISLVAVAVVILLLAYVVPQVIQMFETIGQELPALTRGLIFVSDFVSAYGVYVFFLVLIVVIAFNYMLRFESFKKQFHHVLLRLPLIGRLTRGMNTGRFARTFSILMASGVPVLDAMRISGQVVINLPMREAVTEAARKVREGTNISKALAESGYFPPMTIHLLASGESSGNLEEMLDRAAENQEREVETMITAMMSLFEPLMILAMGGVVLTIVLAIMLPILDMNTLVK
ncbi:MAG: type II secretion system inner membrane protein GspF [Gammaproteobacteria bacterium]|nr:type II secretion system inner membrane protein GspF [Gammaproteobacteria bacterium]